MLHNSLSLTAFEEFFLINDRPNSPSTFVVQVRFNSIIDKEAAELAVLKANRSHPLSRCKVARIKGRPHWVASELEPTIQWQDHENVAGFKMNNVLDITSGPPLKIVASNDPNANTSSMFFLIHHVAFDGLGFFQWFSDWIRQYRVAPLHFTETTFETSPDEFELKKQANLLQKRCRPDLSFWESVQLLPAQWKSVRAAFQVFKRKAIPLIASAQDESKTADQNTRGLDSERPPSNQSVLFRHFTCEESSKLRLAAKAMGTSANSVAIRDLYTAISQWQSSGTIRAGTHFRLMVPINERRGHDSAMSACNHCTIINLDRTPEEVADSDGLLASIDQEMRVVRQWRLSLNFWRALSVFRYLPGGLSKICNDEVSATALITNVGQALRSVRVATSKASEANSEKGFPDKRLPPNRTLELSGYDVMATLSQGVIAAFCLYYFDDSLTISMTFNQDHLVTTKAEALLEQFKTHLVASMNAI